MLKNIIHFTLQLQVYSTAYSTKMAELRLTGAPQVLPGPPQGALGPAARGC